MRKISDKSRETKEIIIEAAHKRFTRFGFQKTTMEEIAGDCDMSAANLYRFFKNKEDIGIKLAHTVLERFYANQLEIIRNSDLSATDRLKEFIKEYLSMYHKELTENPLMMELLVYLQKNVPELMDDHCNQLKSFLAQILSDGNRMGEFDLPDVLSAAETILLVTDKFQNPFAAFDNTQSLETLKKEADSAIDMLVHGIKKR